MEEKDRLRRDYAGPVVLSMSALAGLNALWNLPLLAGKAYAAHAFVVYLLGGSGLALLLLRRALREGVLSKRELGLDGSGWSPWRRLVGTAMIVVIGYGAYANLHFTLPPGVVDAAEIAGDPAPGQTVVHKPSWGDLCLWLVLLSAASLAELLVFLGVGFCLMERGLQQRGMALWQARTLAAVFASVTFGIYHFTHPPDWWPLVIFPLMPVMLIDVLCFVLTRNFYLTLGLHAMFAALGMTRMQYVAPTVNPAALSQTGILLPVLISFGIPFLALHGLEMQDGGPARR